MPELPEVQTIVTALRKARLAGAVVSTVQLRRSDVLRTPRGALAGLVGKTITGIRRRGKHLLFQFDTETTLVVHLGMTGQLLLCEPGSPLADHTHLVLVFTDRPFQLRFRDPRRFGFLHLWGDKPCPSLASLGPEPLTLPLSDLRDILQSSSRPLKTLLTDQKTVAGIGNIYADEILHRAGLLPTRHARSLSRPETARLHRAIRSVLNQAIRLGGSSVSDYRTPSGTTGYFQTRHRVYRHQGKPCKRCGNTISRVILAGRSTHFCPNCQS